MTRDTQVRREYLVFDRKKGLLGVMKNIQGEKEKEMGGNYMVTIIDPVSFEDIKDVKSHTNEYDWHELPKTDPRVQFWKLMDVLENADWYINGYPDGPDDIQVEEHYLETIPAHQVFEQVRKIFQGR